MAPPIFCPASPRKSIYGEKNLAWENFEDFLGEKATHAQKNQGFSEEKSLAPQIFFGPPNLKILPPSLVLGATTVYVCSTYYISYQKKWMLRSCCWVSKCSILGPWLQAILQRRRIFPLRRIRATILGPFSFSKQRTLKSKRKHK